MGPAGLEQGWDHVHAITLRKAQIIFLQDCRVSNRNRDTVKQELRVRFPDYQSFLTTRKGVHKGKAYPLTLVTLVLKTGEPAALIRTMADINVTLGEA